MYLKKLEINGFKSFANKTILDFKHVQDGERGTHGVTAIVGPNGSGKSNIADAIRWVMGEQSMKNLRGKKSEDIIFAGSGKKSRLGSAKVSLFFDNSDGKIPLDFSEVELARKIYRSGESEYLVNDSRVRLQDIVDILAKAGVGRESHAIITQGMADSVLNATPLERRLIIEEAAGVKQYQIKKDRSLRKLETTQENLKRVRELTEEIRPHLRNLKRQAEKAAQGEVVFRELKEKQTKLFSFLWYNFQEEKLKFTQEKEELGRQMMNVQREVDRLTDEINKEAKESVTDNRLPELEKEQREIKNRLNQLDRELILSEGRIQIEKEKQQNILMIEEIRIKSIPVDLPYVRKSIEDIRHDQEVLIKKIQAVEKLEDLQDIKEFARVIQQKLFDLRADIEKGKKEEKVAEDQARKDQTAKRAMEAQEAGAKVIAELEKKTAALRIEIKKTEEEIARIEKEIGEEIVRDKENRQKFFEVERKLRQKQDELSRFKDRFNEAKVSLAKVEVREEDLKAEVLEELKKDVENLKPIEEALERETLERDILKLKSQMEQIGGIDPLVVEEYEETNKRFDFLSQESIDLEQAILSLRQVVREMEQKISVSFSSTFEEINNEFTKYFRIIFGGGNAHLAKLKIKNKKQKKQRFGGREC